MIRQETCHQTYPNTVQTSYTYDAFNRLSRWEVPAEATPLSRYAYTLDASAATSVQD